MMTMIGMMSSIMNCHSVGAIFSLANSEHAADPAKNTTSDPAHNSSHEAADGAENLIPGAGASTGTVTGARGDTLSVRGGCYGSDRDRTDDRFQELLHV